MLAVTLLLSSFLLAPEVVGVFLDGSRANVPSCSSSLCHLQPLLSPPSHPLNLGHTSITFRRACGCPWGAGRQTAFPQTGPWLGLRSPAPACPFLPTTALSDPALALQSLKEPSTELPGERLCQPYRASAGLGLCPWASGGGQSC